MAADLRRCSQPTATALGSLRGRYLPFKEMSICLVSLDGLLSFLCPLFPKCVARLPRAWWEAA